MADNQTEFWRRVLYPPDAGGVNSLVEFDQGGSPPIGALVFPIGTTAQRPVPPVNGMMRYNTTLGDFEFFNGTWQIIPGVAGIVLSKVEDADTDTQIFVENSVGVDDDIIAATVGDNSGNFAVGGNVLTFSTAGFIIDAPNATAGTTAGVSFAISTGGGNLAGAGGDFTLTGGTGGATGDGGDFIFNAGTGGSTSGAGGSIILTAGSTPFSGTAGNVNLTAGDAGSGTPGGTITLTAGDGGSSAIGGGIILVAGAQDGGTSSGGPITLTAGSGSSETGGSITITAGSATEANGGAVTIVGGAGTGGGDGGAIIINSGSGDTTDGIVQLQIDGTEGVTVEIDGTLSVPVLTAGGAAYETQVTDDDDIPNRKFVVDADTAVAAGSVPLIVAPIIANILPTPKAGVGALGAGLAIHPPGSYAFITDDATGPSPFILAYVDGTTTWIRSDTLAAIS